MAVGVRGGGFRMTKGGSQQATAVRARSAATGVSRLALPFWSARFCVKLLRATATVGLLTLLSRVLGFVRDLVFAQKFGASLATDAFYVAFRIPNFMRRLFAEGSFSLAFVPVLAEYKARGDREALRHFIDHVCGTLAAILLMVVGLGILAAPAFVTVFAPGFLDKPEKFALTADMLRVT